MDEHPCPSGVGAEVSGVGEGGVGGGLLEDMQTLVFPDQVQRIASLYVLRSRSLHGWSQYSGTKEIHSIIGESSPVGFCIFYGILSSNETTKYNSSYD